MKKNLLTLSFLVACISTYAQDTYIGDKAIVKVQPNTLFYNGGTLTLNANSNSPSTGGLSEVVKNEGNIQIQNGFKNTQTNTTGKEFVNFWTSISEYGQVIIGGSNEQTNGKLTMQKKSVNSASIDQLPMSIPFQGKVQSIMNSFEGKTEGNFRGNCQLDAKCGQRYWMTLFSWNNNKIVNDAVVTDTDLVPGNYYLLNIISNTGLNTYFNGNDVIGYKGIPAPGNINFASTKTVIPNFNEVTFEGKTYNEWRNLSNLYQEKYYTYLGTGPNDKEFGKNMFRFGNPYTSNIDLRNPDQWMNQSSLSFELIKLTQGYSHSWNNNSGSSENSTENTQYLTASYTNGVWSGEPEAILIRPLEMFRVKFNTPNLVDLSLDFKGDLKTFNQSLTLQDANSSTTNPRSQFENSFHQLKISLVDNENNLISEPVFLASGTNFESEENINNVASGTMLLLEEDKDGNVIANAKSVINTFNDNYVNKPLNLELNDLPVGNSYKLRFNLNEKDIFSENVTNFTSGNKYFIHDKLNDTFTELNGETTININVTEDTKNQYAFYWKETPKTLGTGDLVNSFKTQVYKYSNNNYKIKLDSSKSTANIEIYNVNGTKVSSQSDIKVSNNDHLLKIPAGQSGLYIVKVVYNDATQNNIKVLVD